MKNIKINIKGGLIEDLIIFLEDEKLKPSSRYESVTLSEAVRDYGDGKKAGIGDVLLLSLAISAELVKDLFIDFLKDKIKQEIHSVSYTFKNKSGEEMVVNLNKLSIEEVEKMIIDFKGEIDEITESPAD
jgi:hypothetical protein